MVSQYFTGDVHRSDDIFLKIQITETNFWSFILIVNIKMTFNG